MGLFDKIKKSLFGEKSVDKDDQAKEKQGSETEEKADNPDNKENKTEDKSAESDQNSSVKTDDEQVTEANSGSESEDKTEKQDKTELYEKGLEKTNKGFGARLNKFFAQFRTVDEDFFDDLEELLIESDVGYETAEELTDELRDEAKLKKAKSRDELKQVIVQKLVDLYDKNGNSEDEKLIYRPDDKPNVYLFVGVNGAGKTTTIGKLAKRFKDQGKSVLLAAADTFRAGAVEQLEAWGKRVGVPVVTGKAQADPASVVYDATQRAIKEKADYLLVDTAGRLQNKKNLMNELEKIQRTIKKLLPDQPTETLLVLDGSTGQNALLQAKDFDKTTKLTGLVLTKLDGSSKGGVVLAIRNEMKLPVKLVGLGEKAGDLADFDAASYAIGLFHGLV
ncbi:signal recognition particle-docking protein FtsY [Lactobacillus acetotolerans]|uniref:Signal recognition particle receptor FtsY n=1 Tax=Lactobacillus acetotolerans TaxID=1600 RepID=A0A5P5ZHH4_9LACO|nr:signal recognition particle-docking protein FtsY [Lactobacillus acetotolerans]KRN41903.1 signal recognition particle docking protein FtsY [Lactobacillus acetotolerans DSM 20749 = JCM 3825]QFG51125.1 signal recognition particle-docking protein FtsY [Lactobacillus acetotolerans]QGV04770.1 signal recognition particle-docking protein FtsY [Lactobacillus acetotolerans]QJD73432.1 signal recognition particle-docking protein FtsY [Lactobacillus acetotolerans]GGV09233.1 signal recognition particle r